MDQGRNKEGMIKNILNRKYHAIQHAKLRDALSSSKRKEVYSDKGKRKEEDMIGTLTLHLESQKKKEQTNSKVAGEGNKSDQSRNEENRKA